MKYLLRLLLCGFPPFSGMAFVLFVGLLLAVPVQPVEGGDLSVVKRIIPANDLRVRRNYRHTSNTWQSGLDVFLEGTPGQISRFSRWLDEIAMTEIGHETLEAIYNSGNTVTIRHSEWALVASGRTHAPVSSQLTDGRGEDVTILFDARIPDSGSHFVFNSARQPIEFSALHNLFHELSHARHMANGTWRYFDSEGQAIEEENLYRRQHAVVNGVDADSVPTRIGKRGRQFWRPRSEDLYSFNFHRQYAGTFRAAAD